MSSSATQKSGASSISKKVWIDLENSPHVPLFRPVIEELRRRGCEVMLTARDCFQVCELADLFHLEYKRIGRHYGKRYLAKLFGLALRVAQTIPIAWRGKPNLALSHGSRTLFAVSWLLNIPTITMFDYENVRWVQFGPSAWVMAPEVIPSQVFHRMGVKDDHILRYPGIKEDIYVPSFRPDPSIKRSLGLNANAILVTVRPPAAEAHYHNPESEELLDEVLRLVGNNPNTKIVLLPRTPKQEWELRKVHSQSFADGNMIVPDHVVDGLDLIWYSDLVISGGGTMNREAAALGVPVYSIFRGKLGAVDKYLADSNRLVMLHSLEDVRTKIVLEKRDKTFVRGNANRATLSAVVGNIIRVLERGESPQRPPTN